MKLFTFVALFLVAVQASPQPQPQLNLGFSGEINDGLSGTASFRLGDVQDNPLANFLQNIGRNFFDLFRNNARQGLETANEFSVALEEAAEKFAKDASEITRAATASIDRIFQLGVQRFLTAVNALRSAVQVLVQQSQEGLQRLEWLSIQTRLDSVSKAAQELNYVSDRIRKLWAADIEDEADNTINQWNDWVSSVNEKADLASHPNEDKLVKETLNDYLNTYTGLLNDCVDNVKENLFSFEKKVQKAAEQYKNGLNSLFEQMQKCLRSPTISCQRSVSVLLRNFSKAPRVLKNLTKEGKALDIPYEEIACVKQTLIEAENEKIDLESQIREIVKKAKKESSAQGE